VVVENVTGILTVLTAIQIIVIPKKISIKHSDVMKVMGNSHPRMLESVPRKNVI